LWAEKWCVARVDGVFADQISFRLEMENGVIGQFVEQFVGMSRIALVGQCH
jgi:hypothetical protein